MLLPLHAVQIVIVILCAIGLYAAAFMFAKQQRAERGELKEPSVVQTPRAKATGVSNALLGLLYYVAILAALPTLSLPAVWITALVMAALAAGFSVYLAYSLLFVTRMPCVYCWTGHVVNWLILILILVR